MKIVKIKPELIRKFSWINRTMTNTVLKTISLRHL